MSTATLSKNPTKLVKEKNTLQEKVSEFVRQYLQNAEENELANIYEKLLEEIELPLLEEFMRFTRYNQSKSARILGLSRGTLRKKMKKAGLL